MRSAICCRAHLLLYSIRVSAHLSASWRFISKVELQGIKVLVRINEVITATPKLLHIAILSILPLALTGGTSDEDRSKGPSIFSGDRADFTAWYMAFSASVSYTHLTLPTKA